MTAQELLRQLRTLARRWEDNEYRDNDDHQMADFDFGKLAGYSSCAADLRDLIDYAVERIRDEEAA